MNVTGSAAQHRIFFKLQRAAHLLKKRADDALLAAGGLSTAQAAALLVIDEKGPVSQREVARVLEQNESAMTAMVRRLITLDYVARTRSKDDVRRWDLTITSAGKDALRDASPAFGEVNQAIEARISSVEIEGLARTLNLLMASQDTKTRG
jgi:DNA-binding MarR family transcriptional regulator